MNLTEFHCPIEEIWPCGSSLASGYFLSLSPVTEEIAYTEIYRKNRFVLVENVFN